MEKEEVFKQYLIEHIKNLGFDFSNAEHSASEIVNFMHSLDIRASNIDFIISKEIEIKKLKLKIENLKAEKMHLQNVIDDF